MPYTPEESELFKYLDPHSLGTDEPLTGTRIRELKLTGWTDKEERGVTPPQSEVGHHWSSWWMGTHPSPIIGFFSNILSHWMIMALLTFALRRPLDEDQWELVNNWWKHYRDNLRWHTVSEWWYSYYVGPKFYSHAIYFDPSAELDDGPTILRLGGKRTVSELGSMGGGTVEVVKPRNIPPFPHWDKKIIKRFHRSTDPEMREYTKSVDDWSALMNNAISQLA